MDVQCPKCHQTVVIRRELGESEKLVTHCPTCETAFIVKRKTKAPVREAAPAKPDEPGGPLPAGSNWHIKKQDGTILSFQSIRTLQTWVIAGIVSHDDHISRKGVQWKRIGALPELASFIEKTRKLHDDPGHGDVSPPPSPAAAFGAAIRPALGPAPDDDQDEAILSIPAAVDVRAPSAAEAFAPPKTSWTHDEIPAAARPPTKSAGGGWGWAVFLVLLLATAAVVVLFFSPVSELLSGGGGPPISGAPSQSPGAAVAAGAEPVPVVPVAAAGTGSAGAGIEVEGDGDEAIDVGTIDLADGSAEKAAAEKAAAEKAAAEKAAAEKAAAEKAAAETAAAEKAAAEKAAAEKAAAEKAAAEKAAAETAAAETAAAEKAAAETAAAEKAAAEKAAAAKATAEKARRGRDERRDERPARADAKPPVSATPEDYDALMDQANGLFSANPSRAATLYAKASRAQPALVEPVAQLGWCYLNMSNTAKAFQYFKQAIRMSPRYTDSYRGLAQAYEKAGYRREACEEYHRYLDKVPSTSGRAKRARDRMEKLGCGG